MDREPLCDNARSIHFIPFGFFSCVFIQFFSCVFIHFCRAFLYVTKMRFHNQLMRFRKTAVSSRSEMWTDLRFLRSVDISGVGVKCRAVSQSAESDGGRFSVGGIVSCRRRAVPAVARCPLDCDAHEPRYMGVNEPADQPVDDEEP